MGFWGLAVLIILIVAVVSAVFGAASGSNQLVADGKRLGISIDKIAKHGAPNAQMICPHCQTKGKVLTKTVSKKAGISGAKATGALLTGGLSIVATGLSRKDTLTEAHCANCSSTWHF